MHEQANGKAANQHKPQTGWFNWAERHPGIVLLGALAMALLALQKLPKAKGIERDPSAEEVPLFI